MVEPSVGAMSLSMDRQSTLLHDNVAPKYVSPEIRLVEARTHDFVQGARLNTPGHGRVG